MSKETDLAWAAGLFEGEGCFSWYHQKKSGLRPACKVSLQMTDRDAVERFAEIIGAGMIYGPVVREGNRKVLWSWQVKKKQDVLEVIDKLLPFLCERRKGKALELQEIALTLRNHRGRCSSGVCGGCENAA